MKRKPYSHREAQGEIPPIVPEVKEQIVRPGFPKWLTTVQAAIYLGKVRRDGKPSVGAIRNLIYRKKLKAYKFIGRCLISRLELDRLIELSPITGGV